MKKANLLNQCYFGKFRSVFILFFCTFALFGCDNTTPKTAQISNNYELGILDVKTAPLNDIQIQKIKNILDWAQKYKFKDFPNTVYGLYLAQSLNLRVDGGIDELPSEIDMLRHLRELDLGFANFTELSNTICAITALEELDLSNSNVKILPKCLANLPNLQKLNISDTQISIQNIPLKNVLIIR